jgi:hypothetical protein
VELLVFRKFLVIKMINISEAIEYNIEVKRTADKGSMPASISLDDGIINVLLVRNRPS